MTDEWAQRTAARRVAQPARRRAVTDRRDPVTCEELDELAGALALGAALPDEVAAAREHLAHCPRGGHPELARLVAAAAALAEAVEPVTPPAGLRTRILDAARREGGIGQQSAGNGQQGRDEPALRSAPTPLPAPHPRSLPRRTWGRRIATAAGWVLAAAAVGVAVALGVWNVNLRRDLSARDERLAAEERALDAITTGGQLVAFNVVGPQVAGARGVLFRPSGGEGQPLVALDGLAKPADGRVYQLWAIRGGQPEDLGTFLPDERGRSFVMVPRLSGAEAVAVTVEPRRMPAPTGAPVMLAPLTNFGAPGQSSTLIRGTSP